MSEKLQKMFVGFSQESVKICEVTALVAISLVVEEATGRGVSNSEGNIIAEN